MWLTAPFGLAVDVAEDEVPVLVDVGPFETV